MHLNHLNRHKCAMNVQKETLRKYFCNKMYKQHNNCTAKGIPNAHKILPDVRSAFVAINIAPYGTTCRTPSIARTQLKLHLMVQHAAHQISQVVHLL